MTTAKLKQYRALRREIEVLNRAIVEIGTRGPATTSDTVSSAAEWPYSLHSIQIEGLDWSGYSREMERVLRLRETAKARAEADLAEIEGFIAGIEDSIVRQSVRGRYIEGLSWQQVAQRVGGGNSEDGIKKMCYRYLEKN